MRQILVNSQGALVARMPRPAIPPGHVLVRVRYSLISTGTELAPLRASAAPDASRVERASARAQLASHYLGRAIRDPRKAAGRLAAIARQRVHALRPPAPPAATVALRLPDIQWTRAKAVALDVAPGRVTIVTDDSEAAYQALAQPVAVPDGMVPVVALHGAVEDGSVAVGLLDETGSRWLGTRHYEAGSIDDRLILDPAGTSRVTLVVTAAGARRSSTLTLDRLEIVMMNPTEDGLPISELDAQGWNVGYSAAGEVVAVGEGVTAFVPGDRVACAGAGYANHADFISVPVNLACRVPDGCRLEWAACTTVGTIALQGVRRAAPAIGERIAVLGLGLIGQLTVQLLRAAGCSVYGLDLDASRVERARRSGLDDGAADVEAFERLVRDRTGGHGADRTIVTAATSSDAVVNLAMRVTRRRGAVVLVGDVGLRIERAPFYTKEIDLLMSTSYGPGRYDRSYEEQGRDYPYAHVRWTANRNMQAWLELAGSGRLPVNALIDRVVAVDEAPAAYRELASAGGAAPLAVLIHYPDDPRELPEPADATRIRIRGHKRAAEGPTGCALVGAGAFGTSMLAPQLKRRADAFALRAIVSRQATVAGNFARTERIEVLASELGQVLADPAIGLVVIATRHHEHAPQVVASLEAGRHVFVEKPLALTWEDLDAVSSAYRAHEQPPLLMVGFNRRFAPAMQTLAAEIAGRRSPLVMRYRLNGGYIPSDHWIQQAQGGGRNLGEACHMYDVFRFLARAPVARIEANAIDPGTLPYLRNDNFVATLGYDDGSLASLTYTSLGPKQGLGKEHLEVFADGEAYVLSDFTKLTRASDGAVLWHASDPDKGHREEFDRLADAVQSGGAAPIPFEEIVEVSATALRVEDLLFGRAGDDAP